MPGVGKKRQQKAALKRLKKSQRRVGASTQCPVYKCFLECNTEEGLAKHYNEAHADLKALGLELTQAPDNSGLKGKISNSLLTQVLMVGLLNKQQVKEAMKSLNEEVPIP